MKELFPSFYVQIVGQYLASFDGELPCKLTSLSSQIQLFAATEVQEGICNVTYFMTD